MDIGSINIEKFLGRKESLDKIGRYFIYVPMFYRPSVYFHSIKVFHLVNSLEENLKKVFPKINFEKVCVMALIHDDCEIITGDVQSGQKAKMSSEKISQIDHNEENAIDELLKNFPQQINGFDYKELLLEVAHKNTLEAQVVKYFDHIDAFCEALHEMFAGNKRFITPLIDLELGEIELPYMYYITRFNKEGSYPLMSAIRDNKIPFIKNFLVPDVDEIFKNAKLHTRENLYNPTGYEICDWWKNVLINNLTEEELENLYIQKEF